MNSQTIADIANISDAMAIDNSMPETRFDWFHEYPVRPPAAATPLLRRNALVRAPRITTPVISGRARDAIVAAAVGLLQLSGVGVVPTTTSELTMTRTTSRLTVGRAADESESVVVDPSVGAGPESASTPANRALDAVEDLRTWLGLADYEVAELCGFARRNLVNWKSGKGSYGVATRALLSIHALIAELVRHLGAQGANVWLQSTIAGSGSTALETLAAGHIHSVIDAAQPILFPRSKQSSSLPTIEDMPTYADDIVTPVLQASRGDLTHREPRRPRRVPKSQGA